MNGMSPFRPLLIACSLVCASAAHGTGAAELPPSPEAAVERFVSLNNSGNLQSEEGKALLAGELEGVALRGGPSLPAPDKVVRTGARTAVARVAAASGGNPDLYLYLQETEGGWQVTAFRALALTGVLAELVRLDAENPSSDPEFRALVRNARLTLSSDLELLAWARDHRAFLDEARAAPVPEALDERAKSLGLNRVRREGELLIVSVGGILDNEVGFFFPADGNVPAIDSRSYIWIEPAGGGWYLFKTT